MINQNQFLLDSGFWGFLYKILTPVEWLQTWIMKIVHDFFVMLGMSPVGVSWILAIIILVLVVQACIFPLFHTSPTASEIRSVPLMWLPPSSSHRPTCSALSV